MRVSTAFKRLLRLPGASVIDVGFIGEGVLVTVRLRRRRRVCSSCGQTGHLEIHDRRVKRWRHLDLGASRCWIECELRLLRCRDCGVRLEAVPWARPGSHHTRDFEDAVAWLAQQMAEQAERAYRQLVADWQAKAPRQQVGVAAANGTRLQALCGASCAAGISPRTCASLRGRPHPHPRLTTPPGAVDAARPLNLSSVL